MLHMDHSLPLLLLDPPQCIRKHSLLGGLSFSNEENDSIVGSASETAEYTIFQLFITLFLMYLIDVHALFWQAPRHQHIPFKLSSSFLLPYAPPILLMFNGRVMMAGFGFFPD